MPNAHSEPSFTIGIEEEYLLVNPESRELIREAPAQLMAHCEAKLDTQVTPEFLQCQIEVGTRVCHSIDEAHQDLKHLRHTIGQVANDHGLAMMAASTHPFAQWHEQTHTDKERYQQLSQDMQTVARRMLISGMHVHVGIEDEDLRIDLMNQAGYILPHLLALSTSSPFWSGANTGLMSYRLAVWSQMPRSGLPVHFDSFGEYQRHVDVLVSTGVIEDSTKIWWDIRPSGRFPTIEMRMTDICTRLDDSICIAALYRCWLRMLFRLRQQNMRWRRYTNFMVDENRWRAQRYGLDEGLIDFGKAKIVPFNELIDEILKLIADDAAFFGCVDEVQHARDIVSRGSSAHRQIAVYEQAVADGCSRQEALNAVVDMLIEQSRP